MRQHFWRLSLIFVVMMLAAACRGLAGDVEIVETLGPPPPLPVTAPQDTASNQAPQSADVANGARIFAENCTRCHGENGAGGGELVESGEVPRMPSFLEGFYVQEQSPLAYYEIITNGNIVNLMPPWSEALTAQERWDVAMYVYTLHYDPQQVVLGAGFYSDAPDEFVTISDDDLFAQITEETGLPETETWAATAYRRARSLRNYGNLTGLDLEGLQNDAPPPESLTIMGTVTNGTAGASVPAGIPIILRYGDMTASIDTVETQLDNNLTYRFDNIPYNPNYIYSVVASYHDRGFLSDLLTGQNVTEINELPITLYETIADPSVVTLTDVSMVIDVTAVRDVGTGLVISQTNTYVNNSDRMLHIYPPNESIGVSLAIQVPPGAQILNDAQNPRYLVVQDHYLVIDTLPVYPGEHTTEIVYFLPYEEGAVIDIELNNRFQGTLDVTLGVPQLEIVSDNLTLVTDADHAATGIKQYQGDYDLFASDSIIFDVEGELFGSKNTSQDDAIITSDSLLPILGTILIIFGAAIIGVIFLQQRARRGVQQEIDRLINQISQLEAMHKAGEINHDVFQRQRQELKTKLAAIMTQNTQNPDN